MSKTLTAASMMYQISLAPIVREAYAALVSASTPAQIDRRRQDWLQAVNYYLDLPICLYMPFIAVDGTSWQFDFAATQTIRIRDLLQHTSGLSLMPDSEHPGFFKSSGGFTDSPSIQDEFRNWTISDYSTARTTTTFSGQNFYSSTNYSLLRYVIALFNLMTVCGLSENDANLAISHAAASSPVYNWSLLDQVYGNLYGALTAVPLFSPLVAPRPSLVPFGNEVEYFSNNTTDGQVAWAVMHDPLNIPVNAGAWGWKMSCRAYAHTIALLASGRTLPIEYWQLMVDAITDGSSPGNQYGFGVYHVAPVANEPGPSSLAPVAPIVQQFGPYLSHNGGAETPDPYRSGDGQWYIWRNSIWTVMQNSPYISPFGGGTSFADDPSGAWARFAFDRSLGFAAS